MYILVRKYARLLFRLLSSEHAAKWTNKNKALYAIVINSNLRSKKFIPYKIYVKDISGINDMKNMLICCSFACFVLYFKTHHFAMPSIWCIWVTFCIFIMILRIVVNLKVKNIYKITWIFLCNLTLTVP